MESRASAGFQTEPAYRLFHPKYRFLLLLFTLFCLPPALQAQTFCLPEPGLRLAIRNHPDSMNTLLMAQPPLTGMDYLLRGQLCWQMGRYDTAYQYYLTALDSAHQSRDSLLEACSWEGLASVAWRFGQFDEALGYQLTAYSIVDQLDHGAARIEALLWLGVIHADLRLYRDAMQYYEKGLELAEKSGDSLSMGQLWNMVGRAYRKQEIYDSARIAHGRSIAYFVSLGDSLGISDYYNNVGSIFRREGRYDSALHYFRRALAIQTRLNDLEGLADGYNDLGTTYSQMGRPDRAFSYLRQGLEVARKTRLRDDIRYAYASLAATYDSIGDYRNALNYYRLEANLRDSLFQEEIDRRADLLSMVAENERQEAQILDLQIAEKRQATRSRRMLQVGAVIAFLAVLLLGFLSWRGRMRRKQAEELSYKNRQIQREKQRSDDLLLNILPASIAEEMMRTGKAQPRELEHVTVMFVDFVGFSSYASGREPREVVQNLQECFEAFDRIVEAHGLEKIKTIGDAYMCAGGVPQPQPGHEARVVRAALKIQDFMKEWIGRQEKLGEPHFEARIGIHTGPVVAGVVGLRKFTYDIWGDTVNIAARMESSGVPGRVNISGTTYQLIWKDFICHPRGEIEAKNIGKVPMYFADWAIE